MFTVMRNVSISWNNTSHSHSCIIMYVEDMQHTQLHIATVVPYMLYNTKSPVLPGLGRMSHGWWSGVSMTNSGLVQWVLGSSVASPVLVWDIQGIRRAPSLHPLWDPWSGASPSLVRGWSGGFGAQSGFIQVSWAHPGYPGLVLDVRGLPIPGSFGALLRLIRPERVLSVSLPVVQGDALSRADSGLDRHSGTTTPVFGHF